MRWIALLRAVNVGGTGIIAMADLRAALTKAGAENVASYIQSGNLALDLEQVDPRAVEDWIKRNIEAQFRFRPGVMALTRDEIAHALSHNPWPETDTPKLTHFHFFTGQPTPQAPENLSKYCSAQEQIVLGRHCLYVRYPNGSGRSKLTGRIEAALGCPATARNLNSVRKIHAMA